MAWLTRQEIIPATTEFNHQFLDLLRRIFVYDPAKRITAKEALQHQWFKEKSTDDGTEAARIREEKKKAATQLGQDLTAGLKQAVHMMNQR